jgi:hypothetical protein
MSRPSAQELSEARLRRILSARERLKSRLLGTFRSRILATALFTRRPELGEPDVIVTVYSEWVHVISSLNAGQLSFMPTDGRTRDLRQYADELLSIGATIAAELHFELVREPGGPLGHSCPVHIADGVPSGYNFIFRRPPEERL